MTSVHLLWHVRRDDEFEDDAKLIGVYSSAAAASQAKQRLSDKPGFVEYPEGFEAVEYVIDEDNWIEGFVSAPNQ